MNAIEELNLTIIVFKSNVQKGVGQIIIEGGVRNSSGTFQVHGHVFSVLIE